MLAECRDRSFATETVKGLGTRAAQQAEIYWFALVGAQLTTLPPSFSYGIVQAGKQTMLQPRLAAQCSRQ